MTPNIESTEIPSAICPNCGVRRANEYAHTEDWVEGGMTFPVITCLDCGEEVEFD